MLISYKDVTLQHIGEDPILDNVSFEVKEGEFVYIIGKVGTGKSSLLKSLYCELDIESAQEARIFDFNLMKLKRSHIPDLRKKMGIVFQDFQLLHDRTLYKNLYFVLRATGTKKADCAQRISEVLEAVGLADKAERMPHELSGGEQQRAAIARAILNKPALIIADEPTGNLDPETANGIATLMHDISAMGTSIIMSTHNLNLLNSFPGTVYLCKDNRLENVTDKYKEIIASLDN
ncbi:MAG: ATP-binding cassette domain-containing protein [Bacteroidaceae bacterium]|nr:ATP-binding cassette domain-containing protein [Bacteroidaceae bacterium]